MNMKKSIISFAVAVSAVLMLVACGKKAGEVEGVKIEQPQYSVVLPTGWSQDVTGEGNYQFLNLTKTENGITAKLALHVYNNATDSPATLMQKMCRKQHGWEYQAHQEFGDNKWSVAYASNLSQDYASRYQIFTATKQKSILVIQIENTDLADEGVKKILESIEMK